MSVAGYPWEGTSRRQNLPMRWGWCDHQDVSYSMAIGLLHGDARSTGVIQHMHYALSLALSWHIHVNIHRLPNLPHRPNHRRRRWAESTHGKQFSKPPQPWQARVTHRFFWRHLRASPIGSPCPNVVVIHSYHIKAPEQHLSPARINRDHA